MQQGMSTAVTGVLFRFIPLSGLSSPLLGGGVRGAGVGGCIMHQDDPMVGSQCCLMSSDVS